MKTTGFRTVCWVPTPQSSRDGVGLEHLMLDSHHADSVVVGVDETAGPFRLAYRLRWNDRWQLLQADLSLVAEGVRRSLRLRCDDDGRWQDGAGRRLPHLDGCLDIDIWPTPFTNSFPIRREPMSAGERRMFRMAWVFGPSLAVEAKAQAYTRLDTHRYLFESLDGSDFRAELPVDDDGIVLDYPGLFRRVGA